MLRIVIFNTFYCFNQFFVSDCLLICAHALAVRDVSYSQVQGSFSEHHIRVRLSHCRFRLNT